MLDEFDRELSALMESLARLLSRRKMIGTVIRGISAAAVAAALGQFTNIGRAFAQECTCQCDDCWTSGQPCQYCPASANCPSGCEVCVNNDCNGWCDYPTGRWVAYNCSNLGTCHVGYKMCTDCKCNNTCNDKCTCLSACICCNCCTAEDVRAEMHRLALSA